MLRIYAILSVDIYTQICIVLPCICYVIFITNYLDFKVSLYRSFYPSAIHPQIYTNIFLSQNLSLIICLIFRALIILFLSLSLPLLIKDISAKCEYENYFLTLHFVIRLPPPRFTFRDSFRDSLLSLLLTPI